MFRRTSWKACLTVLFAISHHVHVQFPLLIRDDPLYPCSSRMQQQQQLLSDLVHLDKASARENQKGPTKLAEILKAFFSFFSFSLPIFFCSAAAAQPLSYSFFFLTLPYTEITSAWPRGDTVSILFLINLAHWQSLLNNKALPPLFFSQRGDIFISVRRGDLGFTPDLDFSFARLSLALQGARTSTHKEVPRGISW